MSTYCNNYNGCTLESHIPQSGEIWFADLPTGLGSVQSGIRPVIIISNNANNKHSPCVNVVPMTSRWKKRLPCHVYIQDYKKYGLERPSIILVEQTMVIGIDRLSKCIGRITDSKTLLEICEAFKVQFPILEIMR